MNQLNPIQIAAITMALQNPEPGVVLVHNSLTRTAIEHLSAAEVEERLPDLIDAIAQTDFTTCRIICESGNAYVFEISGLRKHVFEEST